MTDAKKTVIKSLTFETVSNIVGLGLAYAIFGNFGGCLAFTALCFVIKSAIFVMHEYIWNLASN